MFLNISVGKGNSFLLEITENNIIFLQKIPSTLLFIFISMVFKEFGSF